MVNLEEKANHYLIKNFFPNNIIAGFTKPVLKGSLPSDFDLLLSCLGVKAAYGYMNQKHGPKVISIKDAGAYDADALFTGRKKLFLVVRTADCLPLFLANKDKQIGIIHMGWRSAEKGILANIRFPLSGFKVFAGVGLRQCCYRVGEEFRGYRRLSSFLNKSSRGVFFDPIRFAKTELINSMPEKDDFFDLGWCSFCLKNLFFSRRASKAEGRTLSFIGII